MAEHGVDSNCNNNNDYHHHQTLPSALRIGHSNNAQLQPSDQTAQEPQDYLQHFDTLLQHLNYDAGNHNATDQRDRAEQAGTSTSAVQEPHHRARVVRSTAVTFKCSTTHPTQQQQQQQRGQSSGLASLADKSFYTCLLLALVALLSTVAAVAVFLTAALPRSQVQVRAWLVTSASLLCVFAGVAGVLFVRRRRNRGRKGRSSDLQGVRSRGGITTTTNNDNNNRFTLQRRSQDLGDDDDDEVMVWSTDVEAHQESPPTMPKSGPGSTKTSPTFLESLPEPSSSSSVYRDPSSTPPPAQPDSPPPFGEFPPACPDSPTGSLDLALQVPRGNESLEIIAPVPVRRHALLQPDVAAALEAADACQAPRADGSVSGIYSPATGTEPATPNGRQTPAHSAPGSMRHSAVPSEQASIRPASLSDSASPTSPREPRSLLPRLDSQFLDSFESQVHSAFAGSFGGGGGGGEAAAAALPLELPRRQPSYKVSFENRFTFSAPQTPAMREAAPPSSSLSPPPPPWLAQNSAFSLPNFNGNDYNSNLHSNRTSWRASWRASFRKAESVCSFASLQPGDVSPRGGSPSEATALALPARACAMLVDVAAPRVSKVRRGAWDFRAHGASNPSVGTLVGQPESAAVGAQRRAAGMAAGRASWVGSGSNTPPPLLLLGRARSASW